MHGFTLIELAMVLFILALMLGSFLTPLSVSLEQRDRKETTDKLEEIRESLIGYALVNGHFPCPDCLSTATTADCAAGGLTINDGMEDGVDGGAGISPRTGNTYDSCATKAGNLPWVTLSVPENDGWGNHFIYRVTEEFADDVDGTSVASCPNPAAGISFCLNSANDGDINIKDDSDNDVAQNVPVVVVSTGNNSLVAFASLSANEQENLDNFNLATYTDTTFVSADFRQAAGTEFDDLLIWVSPSVLLYQMVRAERLP
ncbi:MAG: prepilin-type N-terminal cleavage/methylation domain-containing protein [Proteobacteria bacterium]|nr:prepilin-type N-terminal cleavage/methylation domain-containing protein [Pseudomonadota bacterium]